jgi:hypothetical protein
MGVSPVTVIVSWTVPTFRSALIAAVKDPLNSIPSRLTVAKPVSVNSDHHIDRRAHRVRRKSPEKCFDEFGAFRGSTDSPETVHQQWCVTGVAQGF